MAIKEATIIGAILGGSIAIVGAIRGSDPLIITGLVMQFSLYFVTSFRIGEKDYRRDEDDLQEEEP